jgi:hypothetical protein
MGRVALAIVCSALVPSHARAYDTVQELLTQCQESATPRELTCLGFVAGVSETLKVIGHLMKEASPDQRRTLSVFATCGKSTYGADVQAFINWAKSHPERWSGHPTLGVIDALQEKWPCHKD